MNSFTIHRSRYSRMFFGMFNSGPRPPPSRLMEWHEMQFFSKTSNPRDTASVRVPSFGIIVREPGPFFESEFESAGKAMGAWCARRHLCDTSRQSDRDSSLADARLASIGVVIGTLLPSKLVSKEKEPGSRDN